jgi:hypothetical protein
MMESMNFVMGNVCDRLDRVERRGNKVGTSTGDVRKVGPEPKADNGSRAERPRWADYEDFEEDVDDICEGGFEDETIGHLEGCRQPRNRRNFGNKTRDQFGITTLCGIGHSPYGNEGGEANKEKQQYIFSDQFGFIFLNIEAESEKRGAVVQPKPYMQRLNHLT